MVNQMTEWGKKELKTLLILNDSGTWGQPASYSDGLPVLRSTNIQNWELTLDTDIAFRTVPERDKQRRKLNKGDIIVTKSSGSPHLIGEAALFDIDNPDQTYLFSNFTLRLRPNSTLILPRYLHYYLKSPGARKTIADMHRTTSGLRNLQMEAYLSQFVEIPYPDEPARSLEMQRRIVARIEALLAEVREMGILQKSIETQITELMRAVLSQTFIELAEKYDFVQTETICTSVTDGNHMTPQYVSAGVPFLFVQHIVNRYLDFESTKFVTQEYYDGISNSRKPEIGDVLLSVVGSYGVPVVVDTNRAFCFQRHIAILKPNRNLIAPDFLRWMLDTPQLLDHMDKVVTGSAQKTLTLTALRRIQFPCPPSINEQERIASHLNHVYSEIIAMKDISVVDASFIEQMQQSILAKAFRGEV